MHVYLHWIATDETERRRAKPFCRESRLRRPPFYPHQRAPTISQPPPSLPSLLPRPAVYPRPMLFAPSRSSCVSRGFIPLPPGRAVRDLVFSSSLLTLTSQTAHTPLPYHAHTCGQRGPPPLLSLRKPAILFRTSFRTRWGWLPADSSETFGFNLSVGRKFFLLNECGLLRVSSFDRH